MCSSLTVKKLERSLKSLQAECNELSARHKTLVLRHTTLSSWSDGMACYQVSRALGDVLALEGDGGQSSNSSIQQLQQLLDQEGALLRQMPESSGGSASSSTTDKVLNAGVETISPPGYPIQFFKDLLQRAPAQQAANITVQEYAAVVRQYIVEISLQLHMLQAGSRSEAAQEELKGVLTRLSHLHASLMVLGRKDVVAGLVTYNLDTLQSDPANLKAATQRTCELARDLRLTTQQCDTISTGVELYLRLLEVNQHEQQSVQAELAAMQLASAGISDNTATANLHAQQLEQQLQLYQRLQALIQKEYVLQFVASGWLAGCLSYEHLARAIVLAWPYQLRTTHLGIGIQKSYREQQQQAQAEGPVKRRPSP